MIYVVIVRNQYTSLLEVETINFNQFGMTSYHINFNVGIRKYVKIGKDCFELVEVIGRVDNNLEWLELLFLKGLERVTKLKEVENVQ